MYWFELQSEGSGRRNEFESAGDRSGAKVAQSAGNFFGRAPPLFCSISTISRFGECFCDGQYSLVSLFFVVLVLTVLLRAQPFVKVGACGPRALWSRRHCRAGKETSNSLV